MSAEIRAIEFHLPDQILSTADLAARFPEWPAEQIAAKTGIKERRIAANGEPASELAYRAATKLFHSAVCERADIDFLLFCSQTPDYLFPSSACVLQERLGLSTQIGALDFNLGCSGFVYGLGMASSFIQSGQARSVLLLTADTLSRFLDEDDKSSRALFGDAGAATLVTGSQRPGLDSFVYGTDGSGAPHLMCGHSGRLYMDGPALFSFTLRRVPEMVQTLLQRAGKRMDEIDLYVFHQANQHMLDHLRRKLGIPPERFVVALEKWGNTVSSSIPIALKEAASQGRLRQGNVVMLVGFGVGFSWGATLITWSPGFVC